MKTPSKAKSHFEQILFKIYARRPRKNECLSVKIVVALNFMCSIIRIVHSKYSPFGDV